MVESWQDYVLLKVHALPASPPHLKKKIKMLWFTSCICVVCMLQRRVLWTCIIYSQTSTYFWGKNNVNKTKQNKTNNRQKHNETVLSTIACFPCLLVLKQAMKPMKSLDKSWVLTLKTNMQHEQNYPQAHMKTHTHTYIISLSLSLSHTHTHTHTHTRTHACTHTCTHTHTHTNTHTHLNLFSQAYPHQTKINSIHIDTTQKHGPRMLWHDKITQDYMYTYYSIQVN